MLELRPSCENCGTSLPPNSTQARICSYECTYCAECAETICQNVCPNCGGGFEARPIRPSHDWKTGVSLAHQPATTKIVNNPVVPEVHQRLVDEINGVRPEDR